MVSFWTWFYMLEGAVRAIPLFHATDPTLFHGFVPKERVKQMLLDPSVPPGTFVLRFSETKPGQIAISLKDESGTLQNVPLRPQAFSAKPSSLTDLILKNTKLTFFYPDLEKRDALSRHTAAMPEDPLAKSTAKVAATPSLPEGPPTKARSTAKSAESRGQRD